MAAARKPAAVPTLKREEIVELDGSVVLARKMGIQFMEADAEQLIAVARMAVAAMELEHRKNRKGRLKIPTEAFAGLLLYARKYRDSKQRSDIKRRDEAHIAKVTAAKYEARPDAHKNRKLFVPAQPELPALVDDEPDSPAESI
jgi:hypothetical protein